ncbi:putative translation initiation factor eIF-2B subunit delta [Rhypophila sp. PSN 637]
MATEDNGAKGGAPAPQVQPPQKTAPVAASAPPATGEAGPDGPKLTPAQLKAKAKAEKAARRAQAKEIKAVVAAASPAPAGQDAKASKGKGKQESGGLQPPNVKPSHRPSVSGRRPSFAMEKDARSSIPECFSHIPMAKRVQTSHAHKDVHPAVLAAGQQMATFAIKDSISRLEATLLAFKKVIESYDTPKDTSLSRHFVPHVLNPQIEYLTECRPMCFSMGNAIRLLKAQVNTFDINTPEDEAKEGLLESIDLFIRERINLAGYLIARNASQLVDEDDVVLTYGRHRLVEKTLLRAKENGKNFSVSIIDDPYDKGGLHLAEILQQAGIPISYSPNLGGLGTKVEEATTVLLGGEAIFASGFLQGAAGTADVAIAATKAGTKVIALCETINFDRERISLDALTYNEIDPERNSPESFRLLFDNTPVKYISGVITEFESGTGFSPAQAILAILRKQEDPIIA